MSDKLEHRIDWEPGHDCIRFKCAFGGERCRPGSGGSHGIHGLQIRWLVIGAKGAVQFLLYTGWLPEPETDLFSPVKTITLPADLGYHSLTPQYEEQSAMDCELLPGGKCYYDGSGLNAQAPFTTLCNDGINALWAYLDAYYRHVFYGEDFPPDPVYRFARRSDDLEQRFANLHASIQG